VLGRGVKLFCEDDKIDKMLYDHNLDRCIFIMNDNKKTFYVNVEHDIVEIYDKDLSNR
jgi:hypothetical protein